MEFLHGNTYVALFTSLLRGHAGIYYNWSEVQHQSNLFFPLCFATLCACLWKGMLNRKKKNQSVIIGTYVQSKGSGNGVGESENQSKSLAGILNHQVFNFSKIWQELWIFILLKLKLFFHIQKCPFVIKRFMDLWFQIKMNYMTLNIMCFLFM